MSRGPHEVIAEAIELIGLELDHIRDHQANSARPLIEAFGELKMVVLQSIQQTAQLQQDFDAYRRTTNEQIKDLRQKVANGASASK